MTTLISWASAGGGKGRCDAKCYDAQGPDCDCICGGMNHGAGREIAVDNTRAQAEALLARAGMDVELAVECRQTTLFEA